MITLSQPKFKFHIFVNNKVAYKDTTSLDKIICYADTYEISNNGTITFYQVGSTPDAKKIKVPVLSYPEGKWETCVLADDMDQLPAFSFRSQSVKTEIKQATYPHKPNVTRDKPIQPTLPEESKPIIASEDDAFSDLDTFLDSSSSSSSSSHLPTPTPYNNGQPNYYPGLPPTDNSGSVPGVTEHNPEEYKKRKNDFLETRIKEYIKHENSFVISKFLPSVHQEAKVKDIGNVTETDIIWAASNLIRTRAVIARKFSNDNIQKKLEITLPDIMKRQWNGKMSPILQVLQDREETKNATAIDVSVWMVNNKFVE